MLPLLDDVVHLPLHLVDNLITVPFSLAGDHMRLDDLIPPQSPDYLLSHHCGFTTG
jgi:hypothetical protein